MKKEEVPANPGRLQVLGGAAACGGAGELAKAECLCGGERNGCRFVGPAHTMEGVRGGVLVVVVEGWAEGVSEGSECSQSKRLTSGFDWSRRKEQPSKASWHSGERRIPGGFEGESTSNDGSPSA